MASSHIAAVYIGRPGVEDLAKWLEQTIWAGKGIFLLDKSLSHIQTPFARNTARAKSKDIVGRAQRRHFGKQRLASALCVTQENRVRPSIPTLSSVLPEITLAHARCDAGTDSGAIYSRKVSSGDRLYSPTSSNNTTGRNKPSKVIGALDIADRVYGFFLIFCALIYSRGRHVHASCH